MCLEPGDPFSLPAAFPRRDFLKLGATSMIVGTVVATPTPVIAEISAASAKTTARATAMSPTAGRWLGPDVWGNRLADWTMVQGAYSCVAEAARRRLCTATVLTSRLTGEPARISVRVRPDQPGEGFGGLLIGAGVDAEHRRAALVGTASGTGGGILAVIGNDGAVGFRDHTDESDQFTYAPLSTARPTVQRTLRTGESVLLSLEIGSVGDAKVTLTLTASDAAGKQLSRARLVRVGRDRVVGAVAMVSSAKDANGPLWTLSELSLTGAGVAQFPERALGPVFATLFTLSGGVLKMSAQVAPFDVEDGDTVLLETRGPGGTWQLRTTAPVGVGYVAALRVEGWDATVSTAYRVTHSRGGQAWFGTVPAEPLGTRPVRIATINCSRAAHRPIDRASPLDDAMRDGAPLPLYGDANVWFPYERSLASVAAQRPDLLVAMGDQYYETSPTGEDPSADPEFDFLYKYLQWLWAVRDLTKDRPTVVLVDDHDVFQGNLWGEGGIPVPGGDSRKGGYEKQADWVNLVQRVQCGHNPDPIDPTPIAQGINVYFTRFDYAAITFAILEDRKFKTSQDGVEGDPDAPYELLGARQEAMLEQLAADKGGSGRPVVVLTQTVYAAVLTKVDGSPVAAADTGGSPKPARDRALSSIKAAGAVMLSGDTHLASLIRHLGLPEGEGPTQFTGPALASSYQRWFNPGHRLPRASAEPDTGVSRDGFGNRFLVQAIANPPIDQQEALDRNDGDHNIGDRSLKSEGYGILVVDFGRRSYRFEAWKGEVDPTANGAAPYPGWPVTLAFDDA